MDFRILGPLEAYDGDQSIGLGGTRQRALLGILLLHANAVVPSDRLIDELWGDPGLPEGTRALGVAVSRLRRVIEPDRKAGVESRILVTRSPGHELLVEPGHLDLHRFEDRVAAGRRALAAGNAHGASDTLHAALAQWRGPPLADLAYESFAQAEISRLEELHAAALDERIAADLAVGRHHDLVGELQALVERTPLRERLRGQLMLALYRSGRQAEALEAFRRAREKLGIEPGRELHELQGAILRHDPSIELAAASTTSGAPAASPRGALVGRGPELAEALARLDQAFERRGGLLLLAGEPGIGKSRLAEELVGRARERGARTLVGRCWEAGGAPAYWPWVQSLRAYVEDEDPEALRADLGADGAAVAQLLPELGSAFGDLPEPVAPDPEATRFRLFEAVLMLLRRAAKGQPLVLVLDDLHAADESSLLLLQFVVRGIEDSRLLVVAAYRNVDPTPREAFASALGVLITERATSRISLGGLAEADVAEFVRSAAGRTPDPATVAAIHARTEGNALFVEEVTRLLLAEDAFERRAAEEVGIPQSIRDVMGRTLRRLSEGCRHALMTASVVGREFAISTLAGMLERDARTTLELLDEALEARAVVEVPGTPGRLRFSHALLRDSLYDDLTATRRMRLHARAGDTIAALFAANVDPHLAELAHHYVEAGPAGPPDRAVDYAQRAGGRAAALLAYEEAARLYSLALDALALAGRAGERREGELLLALGDAMARGGAFGAAKETFVNAAGLARELDEAEQLARAALGYGGRYVWFRAGKDERLITMLEDALAAQAPGDTDMRAMLLARLAGALRDRPVPERRAALTREAVEIARRLGHPETLADAVEGTYASLSWPQDVDRWLAMARELEDIAERLGDAEKAFAAHLHAFGALMVRGEVEAAEAEYAALTAIAHQLRQPVQLWALAMAGVMRALEVGALAEAERLIARELELGSDGTDDTEVDATFQYVSHFHEWALRREQGELHRVRGLLEDFVAEYPTYFIFRCMLVSTYSELGAEDAARAELERLAAGGFAALEVGSEWFFGASLLAEACERLGAAVHAPRLYEALLPFGDYVVITHPEINVGSAARYLGLLALVMGRPAEAVEHLEAALEANERMGFRPWAARTQADLARALSSRRAPGDSDRAAELSRAALEAFAALGMKAP